MGSEKGFTQAKEETEQPVGANQEEGAEKDWKQRRKEPKIGAKRGRQAKNKSAERVVEGPDQIGKTVRGLPRWGGKKEAAALPRQLAPRGHHRGGEEDGR